MRYNITFDVVKHRKKFFSISIILTLVGIITLALFGLNYGVDFSSGSNVDIKVKKSLDKAAVEQFFTDEGYKDVTTTVGAERVTVRFKDVLKDEQEKKLKADFQEKFDKDASFEVNTVDAAMANELRNNAIIAVLIASLGIILYVTIRFEWRFSFARGLALLHNAFIVISIFSIFRLQVNLPFIVAVLTIIGYSINDTIVIFDRIRENLRFAKIKSFADLSLLVNQSIWQTMTRSINTVITVLIAAVCLFIFGSESIKLFSLAMIVGLICGAYSSIFIASPIWLVLRDKVKPKAKTAAKTTP